MSRKQYSKSEIKNVLNECSFLNGLITKKTNVSEENGLLFLGKQLVAIRFEKEFVPSLRLLLKDITLLPKVVVDKGAIKFVVKGADIMRPGIVKTDDFQKDSFVVIVDENFGKPLAIGKSLFDSKTLLELKEGKSLLNLHQIGDKYWEASD